MCVVAHSQEATPEAQAWERLERLLEEHGERLRRNIARLCPRSLGIDPDDIEQEVGLRLWRVLCSRSELERPASYLYRIVTTVTIDAVRRVRVRSEQSISGDQADAEGRPALDESLQSPVPTPEQAFEHRQMLDRVESLLSALPKHRGRALGLYLEGFSTQEIAELLGWTEPRARNLVYRGLKLLRAQLLPQEPEAQVA
jgi:RNA polymerase sigma-70 factor (ECF subfamily)